MIFKMPHTPDISNDRIKLWSYGKGSDYSNMSVALVETYESGHGLTASALSDRMYFVIQGCGYFDIENEEGYVQAGDAIIIPKGCRYDFRSTPSGDLKLILVNTPAFNPDAEGV